MEGNPVIDENNQTADLAVELALSAFGKKILYGGPPRGAPAQQDRPYRAKVVGVSSSK